MRTSPKIALGEDVGRAISDIKSRFQRFPYWGLDTYKGKEFRNSLLPGQGGKLFEAYVGRARVATAAHPSLSGSRRLVVHVESGRIQHIYFSENHFNSGSGVEVTGW